MDPKNKEKDALDGYYKFLANQCGKMVGTRPLRLEESIKGINDLHMFEFNIIMMNVRTYQSMARGSEKCVIASTVKTY